MIKEKFNVDEKNTDLNIVNDIEAEKEEAAALSEEPIFRGKDMVSLINSIKFCAKGRKNILILGESGTGKEVIANIIHKNSNRANGPFVAINCAAFTDTLLESELFGHVKGAYTGADIDHKGIFERANNGTVFLDEIGNTSYNMQMKLLRTLQEKTILPMGAEKEITVNVRVVCATNANIFEDVKNKVFRSDLYYRISSLMFTLPPLRKRRVADKYDLVQRELLKLNSEGLEDGLIQDENEFLQITDEAMKVVYNYSWPGNVRQLQNILNKAWYLCARSKMNIDDAVLKSCLAEDIDTDRNTELILMNEKDNNRAGSKNVSLEDYANSVFQKSQDKYELSVHLDELEKQLIKCAFEKEGFRQNKTAALLGISSEGLRLKLKKFGLKH